MKKKYLSIFIFALLLIFAADLKISFAAVSVPITISESKPSDVTGVNRYNEPVSFGIPLKDTDGITSINSLGLSGATVGQFRVLKTYPSGNIWWVLVDTQASVTAGSTAPITLTDSGTGNFGGSNLASEDTNYITISTGTATFKIKKAGFNFIDSAVVGSTDIVQAGHTGGIEVEYNSTVYASRYDDDSLSVTIEENGPAKVVIKAEGRLEDSAGNDFMGFTVRMNFYKNKSYCKTYFTLKNAYYASSVQGYAIERAGIILPTSPLTGTLSYELARQSSVESGAISGNHYLFQGFDDTFYNAYADGNVDERITNTQGIVVDGTAYTNEYSRGWGEIKNSSNIGVTAIMRYMPTYWPAGIEISNSQIEVDSHSSRNAMDPVFGWGAWETREILFDFHTSAANNENLQKILWYPLMGRATNFSWYRDTRAILDQKEITTLSEEQTYKAANNIDDKPIAENVSALALRRLYSWSTTGGIQSDTKFTNLFNYLRTGNGVLWLIGEQSAIHKANHAITHSDGFDYKVQRPYSVSNNNSYNANTYDLAHQFSTSMNLYYLLSGNEQIKEAFEDYVEKIDYETDKNQYAMQQGSLSGDFRCFGRSYRQFAMNYDLLNDSRSLNIMKNMTNRIVRYRENGSNQIGWNMDRGFFWAKCESTPRVLRGFFVDHIFSDAVMQNIRIFRRYEPEYNCLEDLEDLFLGLSYFYITEFTGGGTDNHTYQAYRYYLDNEGTSFGPNAGARGGYFQAFGYQKTKNTDFLFNDCIQAGYYHGSSHAWEKGIQAHIWQDINRDSVENVAYTLPVGSGRVDMGNSTSSSHITKSGSDYILTWNAPVGNINHYQIKFSDQPMVENLNFNQITRTYQYNPNTYDNYWAAVNVNNEPDPKQNQGDSETIIINVEQVITDYNTRYGLSSSDSAYITYDSGKDYYFSVKYWDSGSQNPVISSFVVNSGNPYTNSQTVNIQLEAHDEGAVESYAITVDDPTQPNSSSFITTDLTQGQTINLSTTIEISAAEGQKTIRAWVMDNDGLISLAASQATVWYDITSPTATISYSTTEPTNLSVYATLQPSESVTVTNNDGNTVHTFTDNGNFTFQFVDPAGNTGSATATVNNIDKISPTGSISYSVDDTGHVNTSSMIITASFNEPLNAAPQILITGGGPLDINPAQSMSGSGNTWTTVLNVPTGDNTDYSVTVSSIFDQAGNNGANLVSSFTTDTIDTDGDGMPDSFENEHSFLDPLNPLDADEDEDGDGYTNKQEYDNGTELAANMGPDKPGLGGPADGTNPLPSFIPKFSTRAYNDNENDAHVVTQWQINTASDFAEVVDMVLDVESDVWLTSFDVYALILEPATTYYWRAKFYDDQNGASLWSEPFSFTTALTDPDDYDGDGIYDDQEVSDLSVDLNNNELPDINEDQDKYKVVNTVVGNGRIGIEASTNVLSVISLRSFDPVELQDFEQPEDMPLGCIDFKVKVENPGVEAQVIVYLSEPAPDGSVWYKYNPATGWENWIEQGYAEFSDDKTSVVLTLTDGGAGDADGVVNGVIVDPSGFSGTASMATVSDENSSGGGGGGGGCFIDTVLSCLPDFSRFFRVSLF